VAMVGLGGFVAFPIRNRIRRPHSVRLVTPWVYSRRASRGSVGAPPGLDQRAHRATKDQLGSHELVDQVEVPFVPHLLVAALHNRLLDGADIRRLLIRRHDHQRPARGPRDAVRRARTGRRPLYAARADQHVPHPIIDRDGARSSARTVRHPRVRKRLVSASCCGSTAPRSSCGCESPDRREPPGAGGSIGEVFRAARPCLRVFQTP
jgi:hypothetical protein